MKRPLQLAALLCGCLLATSVFAQASVTDARKAPGFRPAPNWTIMPQVSVGAFWESNAHDTFEDDESGSGWRVQPSISISARQSARTTFGANAFYTLERGFDSEDGQDSDSYGISLHYTRELSRRFALSLSGAWSHSEDDRFFGEGWDPSNPTLSRVESDESDNYNANAGLSYRGNLWSLSLGLSWSRSDNDEWETQNDTYGLSLTASRALPDSWGVDASWTSSASMSLQKPDYGDTSTSYYLMTGFSKQLKERLSLTAMVGASFQDFNGQDGGRNDTSVDPSYTVSLSYLATRKLTLALSLNSRYESEYHDLPGFNSGNTYVWSHNLTASANYSWTDNLRSSLNVSGFYEEHVSTTDSDADRTYFQAAFTTNYSFNRYTSIYGSVSWSNDEYDYGGSTNADDIRVDVGLTFTI